MRAGARRAKLMAGAALAAAMALSGCTVMVEGVDTQAAYAPPPAWANITGFEEYEWIDRADALSQAVGEAPPDYAFYAGGAEPWAWTFGDGSLLLVENRPDGLHSYYFEGGSDTPFMVRDPEMSFGFLEGGVAVVYGPDGGVLSREEAQGWLYAAIAGYQRGRTLKRAMIASQMRPVETLAWLDNSYLWWNWQRDWDEGLQRYPHWRRVRDGVAGRDRHRRWDGERHRRAEEGDRFRRWGEGGWHGRPPGNWTPPPSGTAMPPVGGPPNGQAGPGRGPGRGGQPGRGGGQPPRAGQPGQPPMGGVTRPGRPERPGDGSTPRTERPSGIDENSLQPDLGIQPGQTGQGNQGIRRPVRADPPAPPAASDAPRSGAPDGGYTPRPGRSGGPGPRPAPPAPSVSPPPPPVTNDYSPPPAPPPSPAVSRPERTPPSNRPAREPRLDVGDDSGRPARPAYTPPEPQPVRVREAPSYSPPPPPSYSPPPPPPSYSAPPPPPTYSAPPPPPPSYSPPPPPPPPSYSPPPPPPPAPPPPPPPPAPPPPSPSVPRNVSDD